MELSSNSILLHRPSTPLPPEEDFEEELTPPPLVISEPSTWQKEITNSGVECLESLMVYAESLIRDISPLFPDEQLPPPSLFNIIETLSYCAEKISYEIEKVNKEKHSLIESFQRTSRSYPSERVTLFEKQLLEIENKTIQLKEWQYSLVDLKKHLIELMRSISLFVNSDPESPSDLPSSIAPLHWSITNNLKNLSENLLKAGFDPLQQKGSKKRTPIHEAILRKNDSLVFKMAKQIEGRKFSEDSFKDASGQTPLHLFCQNPPKEGGEDVLECLIKTLRMRVSCQDNNKETPLGLLAEKGKTHLLSIALCYSDLSLENLDIQNPLGETFLHLICKNSTDNLPLIFRYFLELYSRSGGDIHIRDCAGRTVRNLLESRCSEWTPSHPQKFLFSSSEFSTSTLDLQVKHHELLDIFDAVFFEEQKNKELLALCAKHGWNFEELPGLDPAILDQMGVLYGAIRKRDSHLVAKLLERGVSVNRSNALTRLSAANLPLQKDHLFHFLLEHSFAPPNFETLEFFTELFRKKKFKWENILAFTKKGFPFPKEIFSSFDGPSPIIKQAVQQALEEQREELRVANHTPLHEAALTGDVEILRLLLDAGAHPSAENSLGKTPLDHAFSPDLSIEDSQGVAELLIRYGAKVNPRNTLSIITENPNGEELSTAMSCFRNSGHIELLTALIEHSYTDLKNVKLKKTLGRDPFFVFANIPVIDRYIGPLHYAILRNDTELLGIALSAGSNVNQRFGSLRKTPLHCVSTYRNPEVVEELLSLRADPTLLDRRGRTPLHEMCAHRDLLRKTPLDFLEKLFHSDINLDRPDSSGYSILQYLAIAGYRDLAVFLRYSKDLAQQDEKGRSLFTLYLRSATAANFDAWYPGYQECVPLFAEGGGISSDWEELERQVRALALPESCTEKLLAPLLQRRCSRSLSYP